MNTSGTKTKTAAGPEGSTPKTNAEGGTPKTNAEGGTTPKTNETCVPGGKKNKPVSEGQQQAKKMGYPEAPEGYHWRKGANGEPTLAKNLGSKGGKMKYDPETGTFKNADAVSSNDRGISTKKKINNGESDSGYGTVTRYGAEGGEVTINFKSDLPLRVQQLIKRMDRYGSMTGLDKSARLNSISTEDLKLLSQWYGKEIAVVQSPYNAKLRLVVGKDLTVSIRPGEVFVVHTHPVFISKPSHFSGTDIPAAGKNLEGVVDWSGNLIIFNKTGVKNPRNPLTGAIEPLPKKINTGFTDDAGNIIGYSKIEFITKPNGSTGIKIIPR